MASIDMFFVFSSLFSSVWSSSIFFGFRIKKCEKLIDDFSHASMENILYKISIEYKIVEYLTFSGCKNYLFSQLLYLFIHFEQNWPRIPYYILSKDSNQLHLGDNIHLITSQLWLFCWIMYHIFCHFLFHQTNLYHNACPMLFLEHHSFHQVDTLILYVLLIFSTFIVQQTQFNCVLFQEYFITLLHMLLVHL